MKKTALTFALFIFSFLFAQTENSMLWEISGNGLQKKSYLYGTMHVSNKVSYNLSDSFFDALLNADIVANESNPETWGIVSELMKEKEYVYSGQLYNSFYIKPISKKEVIAIFNNKSHFFYNYLSLSENKNADHEENAVLDMFISQAGRKYNKEITGLEDAIESMIPILQINANDATPKEENIQLLYKILKRKSFGEATVDYYREKNITILDSIYKLAFSKKAHDALIINRNKVMTDSISSISKRGSLFAAVGAAHLAGKEGIINLLIQKGYTVKPVFSQLTERGEKQKKEIETFFKKPNFSNYITTDKMMEIPLLANEFSEEGVIGSPDYANGGLIRVIRNNHNYFIKKDFDFYNPKSLDSLLYENIPGTILNKEYVEKDGISYYDIKNITKTGNNQHYRFYITPLEIIMVSMSGLNNYTTLFENDVFDKIKLKKISNTWEELNSLNASFKVKLPSFYTIRENDNDKSNSHTIQSYLKEDNSFYFVMERNLNDNRTLENTKFEHKQIHYQFYLQHNIDSIHTSFDKNNFLSESKIGSKNIKLKSVISGNKYYLLGSINAIPINNDTFFNSFELKKSTYTDSFITYSDTISHFKIDIPENQNQKLFLNINKDNYSSANNPLLSKFNDYNFKSQSGKTVSLRYNKFHEYETLKSIDSIKNFFKDYILDKRENINNYNEYDYYDEYEEYSTNETSLLNHSIYTKKGFSMSIWWNLFKQEEEPKIILEEKEKLGKNTYTYEALVSTKKATQAIKYKLIFDTNRYYILQSLVPKDYKKEDIFIEKTFNTFESLPIKDASSVFDTKVKRFIEDASSAKDTLRKNTFSSIYKLDITETDFDLIANFVNNFDFKKSELFAKNHLLKELGSLKNKKVVPYLEKIYKKENTNSETQINILVALSNQNTKESYKKIIELLEYDLPLSDNKYDITNMFINFSRNQENATELFPSIFQFYSIKEYQNPLLDFCYQLLEKDLISIKKIKEYQKMILTNAKLEYKRIKSWKANNMLEEEEKKDTDNYYEENAPVEDLITFLNIIYRYPKDKDCEAFIAKVKALDIPKLNIELLRLNFVNNTISNETIKKGLSNPKTAFITIQLLANKNMPFKIENDSIAIAALHNFYDIKTSDSVTFIKKKLIDYRKEKISFYFYAVTEKDNATFTKNIKTIAFFMNGKEINPMAYTTFYDRTIEEDEKMEEKIEAIIKESLNNTHFRASYEKEREENYNTNYLYDDF
ncbi:TraB/GumN family protein [Flavobacterium sp. HNIBRBA15423]|uniref:TraB/GumN family protein n=1 Tax=Flavobacterium sp. HNIBRBA15423 TaxID=3458683 RepID=UPI004044878E